MYGSTPACMMLGSGFYTRDNRKHEDWFFRNGSPVPLAFEFISTSKDGKSAIVKTPRGKTPRVYSGARLAELNAQAEAKEQEKQKARESAAQAQLQAISNSMPDLDVALAKARLIVASGSQATAKDIPALRNMRSTIADMIDKPYWTEKKASYLISLVDKYNDLSGRMRQQVQDDQALEQDRSAWIVPGRRVVSGEIISAKWKDTYYGDTLKLVIKLDSGAKVYGTCPKSIVDYIEAHNQSEADLIGKTIGMNATLEPSKDSKVFGFYSRPAKAVLAN